MRLSIQRPAAAMIVAAVIAVAVFVSAATAHAQILVTNSSSCDILLTLVNSGGSLAGPFVIPASGTTTITPPAGFGSVGVEDVNGRTRRFIASSTPPPGCTGCIPLPINGSDQTCCVDVCYDSGAAKITISACSPCQ
jgi:hypothetical protein